LAVTEFISYEFTGSDEQFSQLEMGLSFSYQY